MAVRRGIVMAFIGVAIPTLLFADDMTLVNNGGYGPAPLSIRRGQESKLRMIDESLTIAFGRRSTAVVARFRFQNTDSSAGVTQLTGFPDLSLAWEKVKEREIDQRSDIRNVMPFVPANAEGFGFHGKLEHFETFVDGQPVPSKVEYGYVEWTSYGYWEPGTRARGGPMAWHVVTIHAPAGGAIELERRYEAQNSSYHAGVVANAFEYIVHSGASWNGTIGQLTATVTLMDGLTIDDLVWPPPSVPEEEGSPATCLPEKTGWEILGKTRLRIVWKDFDPDKDRTRQILRLASTRDSRQDPPGE